MKSSRKTLPAIAYAAETRGENFFEKDNNLIRTLERIDADLLDRHYAALVSFGAFVGDKLDAQASYSDRHANPRLETHTKTGIKQSTVVFNKDYADCHAEAYCRGVIGLAFQDQDPQPHLLSFTMGYLLSQADISTHCPVTMTGAVAYVLDKYAPKDVRDEYLHQLTTMAGDAKTGGTWCTELHGGSDIGATTTRAVVDGDKIRLYGLKWFTSNANSGLALATARPEGAAEGSKGLGLYLVPSHLKDGSANGYNIRRLKDKLGTKGLATGEIDLEGAEVIEIAPPPHGLKMMMEALEYSRVHNAMAAAGASRRAFLEAASWADHRKAFGKEIAQFPMVQNELIDLMLRTEAGTALAFEAAKSFDIAQGDASQKPWLRMATALAKYKTAEDAVQSSKKALELVGGNGYTEEFPTARLYRDAMVLTVWEGPANIQALELLRMIGGKEQGDQIFIEKIRKISDVLPPMMMPEKELLDKGLKETMNALLYLRSHPADGERFARKTMDHMADVLAGALLARDAAADLALGDARKALVAKRYLENAFAPRDFVLSNDVDLMQRNFRALVSYAPIDLDKAGYAPVTHEPAIKQKNLKP